MDPLGTAVLLVTLAVAGAVALVLRRRDGRLRRGGARSGWALAGLVPGDGDRVLLLKLRVSGVPRPADPEAALA